MRILNAIQKNRKEEKKNVEEDGCTKQNVKRFTANMFFRSRCKCRCAAKIEKEKKSESIALPRRVICSFLHIFRYKAMNKSDKRI